MRVFWLSLVVLASVGVSAAQAGHLDTVPSDAVAVVGGEPIPLRLFNQELFRIRRSYVLAHRHFPARGTAAHRRIRSRIVKRFVFRVQLRQKGKRDLGVDVRREQVDFEVAQIRQQWGANEARFRTMLRRLGLTEELLRADLHARLTLRAIENVFRARSTVSDDAITAYYSDHIAEFTTPRHRDVRHILSRTRREASRLRARLLRGAAFVPLARRYSLDRASRRRGGLMTVIEGRGDQRLVRAAFSLRIGAVSQPVRSSAGWHILRAVSRVRPARTAALNEVYGEIREMLLAKEAGHLMGVWLHELELEYADKVSYRTGFAP